MTSAGIGDAIFEEIVAKTRKNTHSLKNANISKKL